ncbi:MAG TPA: CAP domain-containing protein [Gaiellaceae bacterium]|nr:CAP domain-containing protein [Gaiellaceae bacterium]
MRTLLLSLAAAAALAHSASAAAAGHPAILAALNAERAANGIPAHVRENPAWSARCAEHVAYMAATGRFSHSENPTSPEYAASGSWAGEHSVLAEGASWHDGDPFASSPIHLIQLMSPELRQVGIDDDASGYLCMTTWPGYDASGWNKATVYSDPGDGAVGVPYAETANELRFVPGDFVGLPRGTTTGFNIMVFAEGTADPWHLHIVSATLTGPDGPVAVRTVDRTTPTVGPYLPPGSGFVIPVAPLRPDTTYRALVRFAGGLRHSWQFTTAEA